MFDLPSSTLLSEKGCGSIPVRTEHECNIFRPILPIDGVFDSSVRYFNLFHIILTSRSKWGSELGLEIIDIYTMFAKISFVAAILFFFFSIILLAYKQKLPTNYYLSVIFFAVAFQYLSFWYYCRDNQYLTAYIKDTDISFLFLIGPYLYFYFTYITGDLNFSIKKTILASMPFLISLFIVISFNLFQTATLDISANNNPVFLALAGIPLIELMKAVSYFSMFLYLVLTYIKLHMFFIEKDNSSEIKFLLYFLISSIIFSFILNIANLLSSDLVLIGHAAFFCLPLSFIFYSFRYPEFSMQVMKESKKIRYKQALQEGSSDSVIIGRLLDIMKTDKLYKNEQISLLLLSSFLMITPHELSRILNEHFEQNFNFFINSYRIEEAKRLFIENRDMSILDVSYETGFNSKSSFYQNFVKITGITPGEYKKNHSRIISLDDKD